MANSTNTDPRSRWLLRALRTGIVPHGDQAVRTDSRADQASATFDGVVEAATHLGADYSFRATMGADGSIKLLLRPVR